MIEWQRIQNREGRDWVRKDEANKKLEDIAQEMANAQAGARALLAITDPEGRTGPQDALHMIQEASQILGLCLPKDVLFFIFAGDIGQGGRANYASSIEREDALNIMEEFLIKNKRNPEDWMKHLDG